MTLASSADQRVIERFTGPHKDANDVAVQVLIDALGSAYGAALQILSRRRGQFEVEIADVGSGNNRLNHAKNFERIDASISRLLAAIGNSSTIPINAGMEELMTDSSSESGQSTRAVTLIAHNPRPG